MNGGHEPDSRGAFPWHDQVAWDMELLAFYRRATGLRHAHPALRTGSFEALYADGDVYAFRRKLGEETIIVLFNAGRTPTHVELSLHDAATVDAAFEDAWQGDTVKMQGDLLAGLTIPARDVRVLVHQDGSAA
jgi:glycosidase